MRRSASGRARRPDMRLTVIGCGDAFGSGGRFNTCFHLEAAGKTFLVDCGASTHVALKCARHRSEHDRRHHPEPSARRSFRRHPVLAARRAIPEPARAAAAVRGAARVDASASMPRSKCSSRARRKTQWRFPWSVIGNSGRRADRRARAHGGQRRGRPFLRRAVDRAAHHRRQEDASPIRATPNGPTRCCRSRTAPICSSSNATTTTASSPAYELADDQAEAAGLRRTARHADAHEPDHAGEASRRRKPRAFWSPRTG